MSNGATKYAILALDYITKWAKVEPLTMITTKKLINFVVKNIICRLGVAPKTSQKMELNSRPTIKTFATSTKLQRGFQQ